MKFDKTSKAILVSMITIGLGLDADKRLT